MFSTGKRQMNAGQFRAWRARLDHAVSQWMVLSARPVISMETASGMMIAVAVMAMVLMVVVSQRPK